MYHDSSFFPTPGRVKHLFSCLILLLAAVSPVCGQLTNRFSEEEAPAAVFSLDREDADVELFVEGGWGIRSVVSTGFAIRPAGDGRGREVIFPYRFPSFETELFTQDVDLILSLWLYSQYFFEASFGDDEGIRTIAAGYVANQEDTLVREAVVGNVPLTIQRYPFMPLGSSDPVRATSPVPGGVLRLATARTYHEFLVQLERSTLQRRRISASGEVRQLRIPVSSFIGDQTFRLPHRRVRELRVLVEDSMGPVVLQVNGRERRFRELEPGDPRWVTRNETGEIRISSAISRDLAVAVLYTPENDGAGRIIALDEEDRIQDTPQLFSLSPDSGAGKLGAGPFGSSVPLDRYRVNRASPGTGAERGVLLRDAGLYSPFVDGRFYPVPGDAQAAVGDGSATIRIVRKNTEQPIPEEDTYSITPTADNSRLQVDNRRALEDPEDLRGQQFPFYQEPFGESVYGIRRQIGLSAAPFEILLEYTSGTGRVLLEDSLVPGTVQVRRDGVAVPGVMVDTATGELVLPETLPGEGPFELTYRTYSPGGGAADVVAVVGNRWRVYDALTLTVAGGLRWSTNGASYSVSENEHPGQITASFGAEYEGNRFTLSTSLAAQILQPDTTGYLRLYGGDEQRLRIAPTATTLFPAPAPSLIPGDPGETFDPNQRGDLLYRDLWQQDIRGNWSVGNYRSTAPADEVDREGSRIGPYMAMSTDAEYTGPLAVLEWEELAPENWVGALIRSPEGMDDLRNTRAVIMRYRLEYSRSVPDSAPPPELILELGTLGEDVDGDGRASRGRSTLDPTFDFVFPPGHPRAGEVRRAGQDVPDVRAPHREDFRTPGTLLGENRDGVVRIPLGGATGAIPRGEWIEETLLLTPEDAARLFGFRGARVLLKNPSAAGDSLTAGRLLIGTIDLLRSGEALITAGLERGATAVTLPDPLSPALAELSDTVAQRFNPGSPVNQPVLQIQWGDRPSTPVSAVAAELTISPFSMRSYNSLVFYYAVPNSSQQMDIKILLQPSPGAATADSLEVTLPAALHNTLSSGWQKVEVDLRSGEVLLPWGNPGQQEIPAANLPENRLRPLTVVTVKVPQAPAEGTVLLDEFHGKDPVASTAFAGTARGDWEQPMGAGVLHLSQELSAQSAEFQDPSGGTAGSTLTGSGAVHSESAATYTQGNLLVRGVFSHTAADVTQWSAGGHELAIPLSPQGVVIVEEQFSRSFSPVQPRWDRATAVTIAPAGIESGRYRIAHRNNVNTTRAEQWWSAVATPPAMGILTLSSRLTAELRDLDTVIQPGSYGSDWALSARRFIPIDSAVSRSRQERRVNSESTVTIGSYVITPEISFQTRGIAGEFQRSTAGLSTRWPTTLYTGSGRPIRITPRYSRRYQVEEAGESTSFTTDSQRFVAAIQRDPRYLQAIPLVDAFYLLPPPGGLLEDEGVLGWKYVSHSGIRVTRPFTSRLRDLWVPSDVDMAVDRTVRQERDIHTDKRVWHGAIGTAAVDVLQRWSSRELWYQGDELRQRLSLRLEESQPGDVELWSVAIQQETRLFAHSGSEMRIRSTATVEQSDSVAEEYTVVGSYQWRRGAPPVAQALPHRGDEPFLLNRQRLHWTLTRGDNEFEETSVELGHSTVLVLPPGGEISLFADVGIITSGEKSNRGRIFLAGFRAGIEGILRY